MRVLYFGTYNPDYGRNWVLINGLKRNDVEVIELRRKPERFCLVKLFFDYLRKQPQYDTMIVGFPGQEVMFLARLLTRKPIVFDAFTSHYGGYILNRKKYGINGLHALWYRFLDKWSCKLANVVLLESQAYIDFFVREYGIPKEKFRRIWIGANDEKFNPDRQEPLNNNFRVMFYGKFIPVQGTEYIVEAAKLLQNEHIMFIFAGDGQEKQKAVDRAHRFGLKNVFFHDMLDAEYLREEVGGSNVLLGNFGDTPLAPLVISNKVFEALAMKKPVITSDTPANREFFRDGEAVLVPMADPHALARAILVLKNNPVTRARIAERGYQKFETSASPQILGSKLKRIIQSLL